MQTASENHFLFSVRPALAKHRKSLLFRPYRRATAACAEITYNEFDQALGSATKYWSENLPNFGLAPGDIVGCWFVNPRLDRT